MVAIDTHTHTMSIALPLGVRPEGPGLHRLSGNGRTRGWAHGSHDDVASRGDVTLIHVGVVGKQLPDVVNVVGVGLVLVLQSPGPGKQPVGAHSLYGDHGNHHSHHELGAGKREENCPRYVHCQFHVKNSTQYITRRLWLAHVTQQCGARNIQKRRSQQKIKNPQRAHFDNEPPMHARESNTSQHSAEQRLHCKGQHGTRYLEHKPPTRVHHVDNEHKQCGDGFQHEANNGSPRQRSKRQTNGEVDGHADPEKVADELLEQGVVGIRVLHHRDGSQGCANVNRI